MEGEEGGEGMRGRGEDIGIVFIGLFKIITVVFCFHNFEDPPSFDAQGVLINMRIERRLESPL